MSTTVHQPYTTGIQRVVRSLAAETVARGGVLVEFSTRSGGWHRVEPDVLTAHEHRRGPALALPARRVYRRLMGNPAARWVAGSTVRALPSAHESTRRALSGRSLSLGLRVDLDGGILVLPEITASRQHVRAIERLRADGRARLGMLVHDTLPLTDPQWFPPDPRHDFAAYVGLLACADRVAVASQHNRREVERLAASAPCEVFPMPAARSSSGQTARASLPSDPTFLLVGGREPRKNHVRAIDAAVRAHRTGVHRSMTVVLVGHDGWANRETDEALRRARAAGIRVEDLAHATDADLAFWYERSTALVYVSLGEGYGLPVVEALACGTPVITSDRPALTEHARHGGVVLVDPLDVTAIADALIMVSGGNAWRQLAAQIDERSLPVGWPLWSQTVVDWLMS